MNYYDTLILVSDDCPVHESKVPESNQKKQTMAEIEYRLLNENPVFYTQDNLQFEVHMKHKNISESQREKEKTCFLGKSRACMRSSALPKRFGWGIYFNSNGKAELVPVESQRYQDLQKQDDIIKLKALKSKK